MPEPYGVVFALSRHFVPRPDDGAFFAERMTVRVSPPAAINDPTSPYRPHLKAAHRADPEITISFGSHTVSSPRWRAIHNWHPAEVLHFPFRSLAQWENKGVRRAAATSRSASTSRLCGRARAGGARSFPCARRRRSTLERGRAEGSLVIDVRLRDALRALEGTRARAARTGVDAGLISGGVAVRDADVVRLHAFPRRARRTGRGPRDGERVSRDRLGEL